MEVTSPLPSAATRSSRLSAAGAADLAVPAAAADGIGAPQWGHVVAMEDTDLPHPGSGQGMRAMLEVLAESEYVERNNRLAASLGRARHSARARRRLAAKQEVDCVRSSNNHGYA